MIFQALIAENEADSQVLSWIVNDGLSVDCFKLVYVVSAKHITSAETYSGMRVSS